MDHLEESATASLEAARSSSTVNGTALVNDILFATNAFALDTHRRGLQTTVSNVVGLLNALADAAVSDIVVASGHYEFDEQLNISHSVTIEAKEPGSVVLNASATWLRDLSYGDDERSQDSRHVIWISPSTATDSVKLVGFNVTGGDVAGENARRLLPTLQKLPIWPSTRFRLLSTPPGIAAQLPNCTAHGAHAFWLAAAEAEQGPVLLALHSRVKCGVAFADVITVPFTNATSPRTMQSIPAQGRCPTCPSFALRTPGLPDAGCACPGTKTGSHLHKDAQDTPWHWSWTDLYGMRGEAERRSPEKSSPHKLIYAQKAMQRHPEASKVVVLPCMTLGQLLRASWCASSRKLAVFTATRRSVTLESPLCVPLAHCIGVMLLLFVVASTERTSQRKSTLSRAFAMLLLLQGAVSFVPAAEAAALDTMPSATMHRTMSQGATPQIVSSGDAMVSVSNAAPSRIEQQSAQGVSQTSPIPEIASAVSNRRALQTTVSTVADLVSKLADSSVSHIVVASGHYPLTSELSITRSVTVEAAVPGSVVLDAQASSSTTRRVLSIDASSATVELVGLNVTGGYVTDDNGGGISITGGQVTLSQVNIYSNTAKYNNSNGVSANAVQERSWVLGSNKPPSVRMTECFFPCGRMEEACPSQGRARRLTCRPATFFPTPLS